MVGEANVMGYHDITNIKRPIVCVSGGADPVHPGHTRMIEEAAKHGQVIFILNSDTWLERKKGYKFMNWLTRCEVIKALKYVVAVSSVEDSDDTVCEALKRIRPDYFANGGDRNDTNTPEKELCEKLGIKMLWGIGGDKIASSSEFVNAIR